MSTASAVVGEVSSKRITSAPRKKHRVFVMRVQRMREDAYECMWMVSRVNMYAARSQKKIKENAWNDRERKKRTNKHH